MALMGVGLLSFYCVLFPAGVLGQKIKGALAWALGWNRFLFPVWLAYVGLRLGLSRPWPQKTLRVAMALVLFASGSTLLTLFGRAAFNANFGGALGLAARGVLVRLFSEPGAWLVSLIVLGLGACGLFRVSPIALFEIISARLRRDLEEWQEARRRGPVNRPTVVKPRPLGVTPNGSHAPLAAPEPAAPAPAAPAAEADAPVIVREAPSAPKPVRKVLAREKPERAPAAVAPYQLPPIDLLNDPKSQSAEQSESELLSKSRMLEQTLANFGVTARVTDIHPGPVITRYDLEPAPGVKISSIVSLSDDIALAMRATRVRVLAPIPGKGAVGIEIPNVSAASVTLKEILCDQRFEASRGLLTVALGKTTSGDPTVADLAPMPHLLVAGATGSGKSVCIHSLIMSILFRAAPDQVKMVLIDPKRLELPGYSGLPHLYDPRTGPDGAEVITQPKDAAKALMRLVKVMEHRYEVFARANVRNIEGYNEKRRKEGLPPEYYIVVIIDELADLMLIATRDVEDAIQRLAQMARAVGIHLVLATQRPSVDVITGVIKANLPARIALRVASQIDSRVILDTVGAETLVGAGDMLYLPAGAPEPIRLQGAYVSEKEVEAVVNFCKKQGGPRYEDIFAVLAARDAEKEDAETQNELNEALRLIMERRRVSQDLLKAHFGSSARATNVLSLLEVREFIHKPEGTNRWEIYYDRIEDYFRARSPRAGGNGDSDGN